MKRPTWYTFDQRVAIGRFWLTCFAIMLCPQIAIFFFASMSWTVLGLLPTAFSAAMSTCCVCNGCTDPGTGVAVTGVISGFVDDAGCNGGGGFGGYSNCGCSALNGTYASTTTSAAPYSVGDCMRSLLGSVNVSCNHATVPTFCPFAQPILFGIFNQDGSGNSASRVILTNTIASTDNQNGRGDYTIASADKPIDCTVAYGPKTMTVTAGTTAGNVCSGSTPTITFQLG